MSQFHRLVLLVSLFSPIVAFAEDDVGAEVAQTSEINIPKTDQAIKVDGKLDEAFWQDATAVDFRYETQPGQNIKPGVRTTAYVIENGESLYVAIKAYDPNPEKIQASYKKRDQIYGEDIAGFKVDTFNDERKAYNFFVNPLGIQSDSIEDDVLKREDSSWDGIWSSAGQITDFGYVVEIEVPFKVLRFPNSKGAKTWGIDFVRFCPRDVNHRFAYSPNDRDLSCTLCQIGKAKGLNDIVSGNNIELTPYVAANKSEFRAPPAQTDWQGDGVDYNTGMDFRWGVTDNSVLNATVNPDFSQVETDEAQLDVNNRFSLFYSEKRPFFLDGAEYFSTRYNLLHTRNIADPDYGVKYTGKNDAHSYGVLVASDRTTSFIIPGAQSSSLYTLLDDNMQDVESDVAVARYSLDVGDNSQVGFLATNRSAGDYENTVLSIDGSQKLYDAGTLRYQIMHSDSKNTEDMQQRFGLAPKTTGRGFELNYSHRDKHWNWYLTHADFDDDFRTDLGFLAIVGNTKDVGGVGYRWYGDEGDFFYEYKVGGEYKERHLTSGQKYEEQKEVHFTVDGRLRSYFMVGAGTSDEYFADQWFYRDYQWFEGSLRPVGQLSVGFNVLSEDAIDFRHARLGKALRYGVYSNWQFNKHWYIGADINKTDFDIGSEALFDATIFNLETNYHFDDKSYLRLIVRYKDVDYNTALYSNPNQVSEDTRVSRQLLYTYKWNPRTAFYFGVSDNGFENDTVNEFEKTGKSIFTKFSYAFQL